MRSQRGMALLFSIPIILIALLLSVGVLTFMNYSSRRSAIQSAIDISLINAAQQVCSSIACWDRTRVVFIESLQANLPGIDFSFVHTNDVDVDGFPESVWEHDGTKITIERIRWLLDDTAESLEKRWQRDHPGIPAHLVNYGLRVSFETPLKSLAEQILPLTLTIRGQGSVAAGSLKAPCVAPFAIKACALLKEDGDLAEASICDADRRFGPSNGYCRDGERCLNTSEFDYDPMSEHPFSGSPSYPRSQFPNILVKYVPPEDEACFFATPRYGAYNSALKDQNLIGLPGSSVIPNESLIRSIVSDQGGCISAAVGQPFQILHEGLQDSATASVIWDQISNRSVGGVTDGIHRPLNELTDRNEINLNNNINYSAPGDNIITACQNLLHPPGFPPRYISFGAFTSFRSDFGFWDQYNARSQRLPSGELKCPWQDSQFNAPFWQMIVPVVADPRPEAASCGGMNGVMQDPLIEREVQYEIVGFAKVNMFDVGAGSAHKPTSLEINSEAAECAKLRHPDRSSSLPFEFEDQNALKVSGVQLRGRIACGSNTFGGASGAMGDAVPVLVE